MTDPPVLLTSSWREPTPNGTSAKPPPEAGTVVLASPGWLGRVSIPSFNHFRLWKWRLPRPLFLRDRFFAAFAAHVSEGRCYKRLWKTYWTPNTYTFNTWSENYRKVSLRLTTGLDKKVNIVTGFPSQRTECLLVSLWGHFWNATDSFTSLFTQVLLLVTDTKRTNWGGEIC